MYVQFIQTAVCGILFFVLHPFRPAPEEKQPAVNKSKYYLQKHKEREKEIDRLLTLTISKGRNEYEYEMLIKMGEANELS